MDESKDDVSFKPVKVKGKLSSSTMIGVRVKRGLPPPGKDLEEYVRACEAARADAEDALARERIPQRRTRAVLQYFDSVGAEGERVGKPGAGR